MLIEGELFFFAALPLCKAGRDSVPKPCYLMPLLLPSSCIGGYLGVYGLGLARHKVDWSYSVVDLFGHLYKYPANQ